MLNQDWWKKSDVPKFDWLNDIRRFWNIICFFFLFLHHHKSWLSRIQWLCFTPLLSLRLLLVPLSPAEDRQGDQEQPDHHQQEAAEEDEEGGVELLVSLVLRPLRVWFIISLNAMISITYQGIWGNPLPLAPSIKALVFHPHLEVCFLVWHFHIDLSRAGSFEGWHFFPAFFSYLINSHLGVKL